MKAAVIPAVRVSPDLRRAAEAVLDAGETLSGFVEDAVRRSVEFRSTQKAFIERGLVSAVAARKSGKYVPAAVVLGKLARRLFEIENRDSVTLLAVRHQREEDYPLMH